MVQSGRCRQPSKTDRFCIRQHTPKMSHSDWEKHAARYSADCLFCAFTNTISALEMLKIIITGHKEKYNLKSSTSHMKICRWCKRQRYEGER